MVVHFAATVSGLMLALAGATKLADRHKFLLAVVNYRLGGPRLARLVARTLPELEVFVGLAIVAAFSPVVIPLAGALLYTGFAAAIGVNILRGRAHISCGCFGGDPSMGLRWSHVGVNLVLATALVLSIAQPRLGPNEWLSVVFASAITLMAAWLLRMSWRFLKGSGAEALVPEHTRRSRSS
jgi:hypothetical protein